MSLLAQHRLLLLANDHSENSGHGGSDGSGAVPSEGMTHPMEMPDHGGAPTLGDLLGWGGIDPWVLTVVVVLASGYAAGVVALRRRGARWSWARVLSWYAGVGALLAVTLTGVGTYGMTLFSVHMAQHMVLSMVVPVLLLAGAPVTLALRALSSARGRRGAPRRVLLRALHSQALALLAHPVAAGVLFVASLYGLYFTPFLDAAMSTGWGHRLMLGHFVAVGLLFFGPILAIDPWPHRWGPGARLVQMVAAVRFPPDRGGIDNEDRDAREAEEVRPGVP